MHLGDTGGTDGAGAAAAAATARLALRLPDGTTVRGTFDGTTRLATARDELLSPSAGGGGGGGGRVRLSTAFPRVFLLGGG